MHQNLFEGSQKLAAVYGDKLVEERKSGDFVYNWQEYVDNLFWFIFKVQLLNYEYKNYGNKLRNQL